MKSSRSEVLNAFEKKRHMHAIWLYPTQNSKSVHKYLQYLIAVERRIGMQIRNNFLGKFEIALTHVSQDFVLFRLR